MQRGAMPIQSLITRDKTVTQTFQAGLVQRAAIQIHFHFVNLATMAHVDRKTELMTGSVDTVLKQMGAAFVMDTCRLARRARPGIRIRR